MLEWKNSRVISGVLRDPWQLMFGGRVFLTITEHRMQFREGGTGAGDIINRDFYLRDIKGIVPVYFCVSGEGGSSGVKKGYSLIVMFETGPFGTNDWRFIACTNPNADNDSIAEVRSWVDAVNWSFVKKVIHYWKSCFLLCLATLYRLRPQPRKSVNVWSIIFYLASSVFLIDF